MTAIPKTDILFDDFSILAKLIGRKELIKPSANSDCDCIGYSSTVDHEDFDTDQVAPSSGQAN